MPNPHLEQYGWPAVPRSRSNIPSAESATTAPLDIKFYEIWPRTDLVAQARTYIKSHLPEETYNHSLRVYCYGSPSPSPPVACQLTRTKCHTIVTQHLPTWISDSRDDFFQTWALTCLFHDLATTQENRESTHLSFEFHGGFLALQTLQDLGAPKAQAESVCEAIIRHQDPGASGMISRMGQLIQIATEFDNMGWQPYLVHEGVVEQVVQQHPRLGWSGWFSRTIREEVRVKPWCHTTALEGFAEAVEGHEVMAPVD
ncbi:cyanamide hydratase [Teratosphaeria nubilosa]|uniref:Cyanamide hydratase n=1 Tax=Teratosphaeria nubilosa TaxID=161662 RepID=A0A6G1KTR9_9PEZI|nr:cyanamide hydratase [Teratosphaeria nubilosa]